MRIEFEIQITPNGAWWPLTWEAGRIECEPLIGLLITDIVTSPGASFGEQGERYFDGVDCLNDATAFHHMLRNNFDGVKIISGKPPEPPALDRRVQS